MKQIAVFAKKKKKKKERDQNFNEDYKLNTRQKKIRSTQPLIAFTSLNQRFSFFKYTRNILSMEKYFKSKQIIVQLW